MTCCYSESKLLASLAVFRELYDSKKDVYVVISEFIREIVVANGKHQFNITEITQLLNSTFDFNLPDAVVQFALNKIDSIEKTNGLYNVNIADFKKTDFVDKQIEIQRSNSLIINNLLDYIGAEKNEKLNAYEKGKVVDSLCSFLLDDQGNQEYLKYISAFIIKNKADTVFADQISLIKEGIILYSGIKYSNDLINVGSWTTPLTIFIDTEVLFNFAGYDGELYRALFIDFLAFVNDINKKDQPKLIKLRYFTDVINEIERFFAKAEQIVLGKEKLILSKTAMSSIVDGCKTASDVITKKTIFYDLLLKNGIIEDDYKDYYLPDNHIYNISDKNTIAIVSKSLGKDDISEHLNFLNYISIHRKDSNTNNFENIGYILLSGNTLTQRVAWHKEIKKPGCVPLVTNMGFLTNKFWFKLNKGFGKDGYPKTFDVITKAQMVLASQLNDSVGIQFEILQAKYRKGDLSEEQAIATIANLRKQSIRPENIVEDNITDVLSFITEDKIEKYMLEHEHIKNVATKKSEENEQLKENLEFNKIELKAKEIEADNYKKAKEAKESEIIQNNIEAKETLIKEKSDNLYTLNQQLIPIKREAKFLFVYYRIGIGFLLILLYTLVCLIIWKMGWNIIEAWTYIIGVLLSNLLPLFYLLLFEKNINPKNYLENIKSCIYLKTYSKFNFDTERLIILDSEIEKLKAEVGDLKKASTQQTVKKMPVQLDIQKF